MINDRFELNFNEVLATQVIFQKCLGIFGEKPDDTQIMSILKENTADHGASVAVINTNKRC